MKRWAFVVLGLYLLILVVLTVPVTLLAFAPKANVKDVVECYGYLPYWLWVGVMVLGQAALMLRGSIIELLIAVPTHIVSRSRDYCGGGFMTFIGLTLGISVMLFSYGPAVFFSYVDRWRRLHPAPAGEMEQLA